MKSKNFIKNVGQLKLFLFEGPEKQTLSEQLTHLKRKKTTTHFLNLEK